MSNAPRQYSWGNILFLVLSPLAAVAGTIWHVKTFGLHASDLALFVAFYLLTGGIGICAGYHRRFAHRSYDCNKFLDVLYLLFGAAAMQNSVLRWSRDHRLHHKYIDGEKDPYNIKRGFFYAHMGWVFYKNPDEENLENVPDLLKSRMIVWQDRYYLPIAIGVGFVLPTLLGWIWGRPLAGFIWGGLVRTVVVHHFTFFINSLAHMVGSQPFSLSFSARDSWWLAFLTYGEGYHNFHHRFAADYRNGYRWYQWDPTKWWINCMRWLGLVERVTCYRREVLMKARIETDIERVRQRMLRAPDSLAARVERRLQEARLQLESAMARWERAKHRYQEIKSSAVSNSERALDIWKLKLRQYRLQLQTSQAQWALLIAAVSRLTHHGNIS